MTNISTIKPAFPANSYQGLICAGHCSKCFKSLKSLLTTALWHRTLIIPMSQMGKLRHGEVKIHAQGYSTVGQGSPGSRAQLSTTVLSLWVATQGSVSMGFRHESSQALQASPLAGDPSNHGRHPVLNKAVLERHWHFHFLYIPVHL